MSGARERGQHVADAQRIGIGQVERAAVEPVEMGEMIHCRDDEIDRHDVDPAALEADHWNPGWHGFAQLLDQLEEVVGAVDLVDLAGRRVADDDAGSIDAPRNCGLGADKGFAPVLRGKVGVIEPSRFLEHVLAEDPVIEAGRRDGTHVMEAARLDHLCESERVRHAGDVRRHNFLGVGGEVVNGGEVKETVDLALEPSHILGRDAEIGLRNVAFDRRHALAVLAAERL